ncbi:hypothetical protein [Chitinophaga solisilvae]|uniref:hypothetical protein n=1 Tax=Chitinophaga solisilvae TaxID=1233460 RepID=UPI00136813E7|nr:hypothetical protein [Chitinophaga solisilvae]
MRSLVFNRNIFRFIPLQYYYADRPTNKLNPPAELPLKLLVGNELRGWKEKTGRFTCFDLFYKNEKKTKENNPVRDAGKHTDIKIVMPVTPLAFPALLFTDESGTLCQIIFIT